MTSDHSSRTRSDGAAGPVGAPEVRARRAGEFGVLFELAPQHVAGLASWLAAEWADVIEEVVPGQCTVLVRARGRLGEIVSSVRTGTWSFPGASRIGEVFRVPVRYDGPDLAEVSTCLRLPPERIIELHTGVEHVVQHFGFSPGFPYLAGSPEELDVPRRATPRAAVPTGSLAIAGRVTIIYPGGTPGGWNIIGHAELPVFWDLGRDPPSLFDVGDRIVFERVE